MNKTQAEIFDDACIAADKQGAESRQHAVTTDKMEFEYMVKGVREQNALARKMGAKFMARKDGQIFRSKLVFPDGSETVETIEFDRIKCLRTLKNMTQQQLADASGMNISQIQRLESGEASTGNITLLNALSLARALDVEPADLIGPLS